VKFKAHVGVFFLLSLTSLVCISSEIIKTREEATRMMSVSCKDMGATDCDYTAKGETAQDVKDDMIAHAMSDHKEMMDMMSESEKSSMMAKMDMAMKTEM